MSDILPQDQVQQTADKRQDHSAYELKMIWGLRKNLFRLYAIALILSIPTAAVITIITRNAIPFSVPTSLLLAMKPIVKWAFSRQTS